MRSSIACLHCRRSKIKCTNTGVDSLCDACSKSDRKCEYPPTAVPTATARRESLVVGHHPATQRIDSPGEPPRKRPKKVPAPTSYPATVKTEPSTIDLLDPAILTPEIWKEQYEIWQRHFGSDFPFIHGNMVRMLVQPDAESSLRPYSDVFKLSFLALTSRFCKALVTHFDASDPLKVTEAYASAARKLLDSDLDTSHTLLEQTQANLMLCMHEWGMRQGLRSRRHLTLAILYAHTAGLHTDSDELELSREREHRTRTVDPNIPFADFAQNNTVSNSKEHSLLEREIQRRTYWSCFVMDRYLTGGFGNHDSHIQVEKIRIPLPISDDAFNFIRSEKTRFITAPKHPSDAHEGALSCYIRALEIYSDAMGWSLAGGRRSDERPPWDPDHMFSKLEKRLDDFNAELPIELQLNDQNTTAHSQSRSPTHYILMHSCLLLARMMLHREYLPFLPFACSKPAGPIDEPKIKEKPPPDRADFWVESARGCFKSTRQLFDLIHTYYKWSTLVETPLSGYAIYQVCQVVVWRSFFPQYDPDNCLRSVNFHLTTAWSMLCKHSERSKWPRDWRITIMKLKDYLSFRKKDYQNAKRSQMSADSSSESDHSSYLEGGGIDDWKRLEPLLKSSGNRWDEDKDYPDGGFSDMKIDSADNTDHGDKVSESSDEPHPHWRTDATPASNRTSGFTSVNGNAASRAAAPPDVTQPTQASSSSRDESYTNPTISHHGNLHLPYSSHYSHSAPVSSVRYDYTQGAMMQSSYSNFPDWEGPFFLDIAPFIEGQDTRNLGENAGGGNHTLGSNQWMAAVANGRSPNHNINNPRTNHQ